MKKKSHAFCGNCQNTKTREYWIEKRSENVRWKVCKGCPEYVQEVAEDEGRMLEVGSIGLQMQQQAQQKEQQHWILEDGVDITDLFNKFRAETINMLNSDANICLESHVQELAALNRVLIIKPHQHSVLMRSMFSDKVLDSLLQYT